MSNSIGNIFPNSNGSMRKRLLASVAKQKRLVKKLRNKKKAKKKK